MKISVHEAAKLLGVTPPTIYNKIKCGELERDTYGLVDDQDVLKLELMPLAFRRYVSKTTRRGYERKKAAKENVA